MKEIQIYTMAGEHDAAFGTAAFDTVVCVPRSAVGGVADALIKAH